MPGKQPVNPPAIRTLPLGSKVAVWPKRGVIMLPVLVNVPADCAIATPETNKGRIKSTLMPGLKNKSLNTNADFIARAAEVGQAHPNGGAVRQARWRTQDHPG